ncbi:hypothetical protein L916_14345 [Phytophthora nicotianae]|nr:hypothetical protein L916_14345 [Phytophthora nicotianae]
MDSVRGFHLRVLVTQILAHINNPTRDRAGIRSEISARSGE